MKNGRYIDLGITNRKKGKSKRKKYYVLNNLTEKLKLMYQH